MRKILLLLAVASVLTGVREISAQMISLSATPGSQAVSPGGSFNVSLTVSVPAGTDPNDVSGFDLYLVTGAANSGYFSITAAAPASSFDTPAGPEDPSNENDPLTTPAMANGVATGYVQNGIDQGFIGTAQSVPTTDLALETLTLSVAANTPENIYTFQTTTSPTAGVYYSDVSDSDGNTYEATSPGTFSITVVPEPSTLALVLCGAGLLCAGRRWHRADRRRRAALT